MSLSFLSVSSTKIQTQWMLILCTYNTAVVIYPSVWLVCHISLECKLFAWVVCVFNTLCGLPEWCFEAIFISRPFGMSSHNAVCFCVKFLISSRCILLLLQLGICCLIKNYADEKSDKDFNLQLHLEINRNTLTVTKFPNLGFIVWYHCHFMKKQR